MHELDHAACLRRLPRVIIAGSCILVRAEHPARHLPVLGHDLVVVAHRGVQMGRIMTQHVVFRRLAEALGDVHAVPVDDALVPACHASVDLVGKLDEAPIARPVVEPVDALQVVPGANGGPVAPHELVLGHGKLPLEVPSHEVDHARIAGVLVVGLKAVEGDHVGPEVRRAVQGLLVLQGAEPAVCPLAGQDPLYPDQGFGDHVLVIQDIGEVAVAFEPIGQLLPSCLACSLGIQPGVAFLDTPGADSRQLADLAIAHQAKLVSEPSARLYAPDRQLVEGTGQQGRRIADVVVITPFRIRP